MNVISVIIGILNAILMLVGLVVLLGWINWFVLAGCVAGIIFGALSSKRSGVIINTAVMAVAIVRLVLGGGII